MPGVWGVVAGTGPPFPTAVGVNIRRRLPETENNRSEASLYERLGRGRVRAARAGSRFPRILASSRGFLTRAGRILRKAAWSARWQARHIYQLATVRYGRQRSPNARSSLGVGMCFLP